MVEAAAATFRKAGGRMTVYVDDMMRPYRGMLLCHMIADTLEELHGMADRVGVAREHFQNRRCGPHYDIAKSRRLLAIDAGAVEISLRECACMMARWRATGQLGTPETAIAWLRFRRVTCANSVPAATPDDIAAGLQDVRA
jgi:hypothetical protein